MDRLQNNLQNLNIGEVLQTPENTPESNLDDLITHVEDMTLKHKKQTPYPNLNLEVPNIYCRQYFDDEDFIYMRLDIPSELYNRVEVFSDGDISTDSIFTFLSNVSEEEYDGTTFNRFQLVSFLFSQVRYYYENEESLEELHPFLFDVDFMEISYKLTNLLIENCIFDPDNEIHQHLNDYEKEVVYGCGLIIHQIRLIVHSYQQLNITSMNCIIETHQERLIRLVNNLCVCILYFKFKGDHMVENGYEADTEMDTPDDWKIITEM